MPAPKGHPPYAGCEKGAAFGYLGKPQDAYTQEELIKLGKELVEWFGDNPMEVWLQDFFIYRGISKDVVKHLLRTYPSFCEYYQQAKDIQESRLNKYPFWKKADGAHARFMLARHHEGYKDADKDEDVISSKAASAMISDLIKRKDKDSEK
jgi:hypothetical protein